MDAGPEDLLAPLVSGKFVLPAMPQVISHVLGAIDADATVAQLAKIVSRDQVLSGQLLRFANSGFYGGTSQAVRGIEQAIARVGDKAVWTIAAAQAQNALYHSPNAQAEAYLRLLWRHALGVALTSELLARRLGEPEPATHFLAGLVHDIGETAILALGTKAEAAAPVPDEDVVKSLHNRAGGLVLSKWKFPDELIDAAVHHHDLPSERTARMTLIVAVADNLCEGANVTAHFVPEERAWALESLLGVDDELHEDALTDLEARVDELNDLLR